MAAKVDHDPGDIAEEGNGDGGADERQQGLNHTEADHIVSALRTIPCTRVIEAFEIWIKQVILDWLNQIGRLLTDDISQGPDGLFTDILVRRVEQPQEQRNSI